MFSRQKSWKCWKSLIFNIFNISGQAGTDNRSAGSQNWSARWGTVPLEIWIVFDALSPRWSLYSTVFNIFNNFNIFNISKTIKISLLERCWISHFQQFQQFSTIRSHFSLGNCWVQRRFSTQYEWTAQYEWMTHHFFRDLKFPKMLLQYWLCVRLESQCRPVNESFSTIFNN